MEAMRRLDSVKGEGGDVALCVDVPHIISQLSSHRKKAAIFGGARTSKEVYDDTVQIGRILTEKNYHLKTGGYGGVMEAAPKGAAGAGGHSTGYTCSIFPSTVANKYINETVVTGSLYERLSHMIEDTDVFVIQLGGIGTLAELFLTMDILRKKKEGAPKIILVGSAWKELVEASKVMLTHGETDGLIFIDDSTGLNQHI